ncbi:hypothetical protein AltI4_26920 [Alteromonas sp. I4]|nr:hypothetical protein AltI4_26920 [Alteromonas sp. I4]
MTPSIDLRLQTMMRSVQQSILPALDTEDSLAQEQVKLLMGHIAALQLQCGKEQDVCDLENQHLKALALDLIAKAEGGADTQKAINVMTQALEDDNYVLLSLATENALAATDASEAFKSYSWDAVITYSTEAAKRAKDWFKPMGF